jgi:hypothetical protein
VLEAEAATVVHDKEASGEGASPRISVHLFIGASHAFILGTPLTS